MKSNYILESHSRQKLELISSSATMINVGTARRRSVTPSSQLIKNTRGRKSVSWHATTFWSQKVSLANPLPLHHNATALPPHIEARMSGPPKYPISGFRSGIFSKCSRCCEMDVLMSLYVTIADRKYKMTKNETVPPTLILIESLSHWVRSLCRSPEDCGPAHRIAGQERG